jgi:4-amino-4-deoxy-L-arabinose transferase-like glycosyltransferase
MVSVEATERAPRPAADLAAESAGVPSRRRALPLAVLAAIFIMAFGARLLAHDVVITADEDNWMRRAGGFTFGLLNGQFGRTYQNGHPGVTTMWVAMLTLGPERMVQYADRVHNQRLVGRVAGFWDALVDARPGFALVTALLVTLIAGLAWRLFGGLVGGLTGLIVGLEPFLLGISQLVHMDAILSGCMVASVLMALVAWTRGGGRGWLVGSGILAGLAILSKVPAVYLLAFVPALGIGLALQRSFGQEAPSPTPPPCEGEGPRTDVSPLPRKGEGLGEGALSTLALDLLVWGAATVAAFVAGWPAIWVLGPAEVLGRVVDFTKETGGQPHEQGTFFWGMQTADPGPFYYPVSLGFRLAPLTVLGLVLLALCWRRLRPQDRLPTLGLVGYALGFLLMMTLGAKKLDRYVLPLFPAFGVLAALGLTSAYRWLCARGLDGSQLGPSMALRWRAVAVALVVVLAIWPAAATYPYFLAYYSPLLGGGPAAQRTVMVGNGEGLDQVAAWLNDQPGAADLWVVSHSFDILQALIVGSGESLRDRVPSNADYVVLYRFQIQIGHSPRVLDEYLNRRTPEHVVWINGVEYARIYQGPHRLALEGPATPNAAPAAAAVPTAPADAAPDAVRPGARAIASTIPGWESQLAPRLRRLRSRVTALIPAGSEGAP